MMPASFRKIGLIFTLHLVTLRVSNPHPIITNFIMKNVNCANKSFKRSKTNIRSGHVFKGNPANLFTAKTDQILEGFFGFRMRIDHGSVESGLHQGSDDLTRIPGAKYSQR